MPGRPRFISRLCSHTFVSALLDRGSVVVDLGLNQGEFARGIHAKFGCAVYGAEPVPELFEALRGQAGLAAENCAIAAKAGSQMIHLAAGRCASLSGQPSGVQSQTIEVRTVPLAEFLSSHRITGVDLLKVDIEGAELEVFANLPADVLAEFRQITIEFHDFMHPETAPEVQRTIDNLRAAGFRCVRFSKDNIDLLFINSRRVRHAFLIHLLASLWFRPWLALTRKIRRLLGNQNPDHF